MLVVFFITSAFSRRCLGAVWVDGKSLNDRQEGAYRWLQTKPVKMPQIECPKKDNSNMAPGDIANNADQAVAWMVFDSPAANPSPEWEPSGNCHVDAPEEIRRCAESAW
jgi:hypothetical protein